jgi:hypothetical protein
MNSKLNKTKKINFALAFVTGLLLVSIILFFNYINIQFRNLATKRQEYNQGVTNSRPLQKINEELKFVEGASKYFDELYVDTNNMANFVSYLEELARRAGAQIQIKSINASVVELENENIKEYQNVEITLELAGPANSVNNYIKIIENLPHQVSISELQLIKSSDDAQEYKANLKLNVVAR